MPWRLLTPPSRLPVVLLLAAGLSSCGTDDGPETARDSAARPTTNCQYPADGQEPAKAVERPSEQAPSTGETPVTLTTSEGEIRATLDNEAAPCAVHSFVSLAEQGYFDDTPCHRLTTQGIFVLQCGDPSGTGTQGPGYSFADELSGKETYPAGTIAMANAGPDTNGSQFFLVYEDTELPPSYTVLGTMDDAGTDVVRMVAQTGVQGGGADGPPAVGVVIESATAG